MTLKITKRQAKANAAKRYAAKLKRAAANAIRYKEPTGGREVQSLNVAQFFVPLDSNWDHDDTTHYLHDDQPGKYVPRSLFTDENVIPRSIFAPETLAPRSIFAPDTFGPRIAEANQLNPADIAEPTNFSIDTIVAQLGNLGQSMWDFPRSVYEILNSSNVPQSQVCSQVKMNGLALLPLAIVVFFQNVDAGKCEDYNDKMMKEENVFEQCNAAKNDEGRKCLWLGAAAKPKGPCQVLQKCSAVDYLNYTEGIDITIWYDKKLAVRKKFCNDYGTKDARGFKCVWYGENGDFAKGCDELKTCVEINRVKDIDNKKWCEKAKVCSWDDKEEWCNQSDGGQQYGSIEFE